MQRIYNNQVFSKFKKIKNITNNSKGVKKGDIFFAISGGTDNGNLYIKEAILNGAIGIVSESKKSLRVAEKNVQTFLVKNSRKSYSHACVEFFSRPSSDLQVCGITGTNGKTSIAHLLKEIWKKQNSGLIGTIETNFAGTKIPSSLTTPDSYQLNKLLKEMKKKKVKKVFIEVSSHALDMSRVDYIQFDSCIFTNLTRDHLDFHKTMESYFSAKAKLFLDNLYSSRKKNKLAIVNLDDKWGSKLIKLIGKKINVVTYSLKDRKADFYVESIVTKDRKSNLLIKSGDKDYKLETLLFGDHNFQNILASFAYSIMKGLDIKEIQKRIKNYTGAPGRLQRVKNTELEIFIDYAHTPDALKKSIISLKKHFPDKNIIVLFGCGGNRDIGKREKMGGVAEKFADKIVVTSDNPRFEDPKVIIDHICKGFKADRKKPKKTIVNRKEAISWSVRNMKRSEVLLIAGKGHEDYQAIKGVNFQFSDYKEVKKCLKIIN